jgi:hypothetical protein
MSAILTLENYSPDPDADDTMEAASLETWFWQCSVHDVDSKCTRHIRAHPDHHVTFMGSLIYKWEPEINVT